MAKLKRPPKFEDTRSLPSNKMLAAIGRTAVVSTSIEDILHRLHWKYAGLSTEVGPVITGDARATRLTEDILRIAKAAKAPQKVIDDLSDIFADLGALIVKRNECSHWLWDIPKGRKHTRGIRRATKQEKRRKYLRSKKLKRWPMTWFGSKLA
jgi:hypothetical protein